MSAQSVRFSFKEKQVIKTRSVRIHLCSRETLYRTSIATCKLFVILFCVRERECWMIYFKNVKNERWSDSNVSFLFWRNTLLIAIQTVQSVSSWFVRPRTSGTITNKDILHFHLSVVVVCANRKRCIIKVHTVLSSRRTKDNIKR